MEAYFHPLLSPTHANGAQAQSTGIEHTRTESHAIPSRTAVLRVRHPQATVSVVFPLMLTNLIKARNHGVQERDV